MKRIFTALQLKEGERIPRWYGIAYYEDCMDAVICYPIPINWIVGVWHWLPFFLMRADFIQLREQRIYEKGKKDGILTTEQRFQDLYEHAWADGHKAAHKAIEGELDRHARERNARP